jgi:hypothetical protein
MMVLVACVLTADVFANESPPAQQSEDGNWHAHALILVVAAVDYEYWAVQRAINKRHEAMLGGRQVVSFPSQ